MYADLVETLKIGRWMVHESSLTSLVNYIVDDYFNIKKWIK